MRQNRLKMGRHPIAFSKAAFTVRMPAKRPEIGPVIDIERHLAAELPRQLHRRKAGAGHAVGAEMRAGHQNGPCRGDEVGIDVLFRDRHVGAVLAIEDQRKLLAVPDSENDERRQPFRVGDDMACINPLAVKRLADEPAHMFVANAGDHSRLQAKARAADTDIGRAATDIFRKAGHILEPTADLAAIEIDGRPADADHIQRRLSHFSYPFHASVRSRWQDTGSGSSSRRASGTRTGFPR